MENVEGDEWYFDPVLYTIHMALKYNQGDIQVNPKSFPNIVNIQRRQVLPERLIYEHSISGWSFFMDSQVL